MLDQQLAIYRLTALWAFVECGLGGVLHALKIPLTGFLVGAMAVIVICLIAKLAPQNKSNQIFQALIVVLLIKISVTPHAGFGAFLAVLLQGCFGMFIFGISKNMFIGSVILGIFTMVESALQKIAVLTMIYGATLWEAVDGLTNWVAGNFGFLMKISSSKNLILLYTLLYAIWGILVGIYAFYLSRNLWDLQSGQGYEITLKKATKGLSSKGKKRYYDVYYVLILCTLYAYLFFKENTSGILFITIRVLLVIFIFYKIVAPFLTKILRYFLLKTKFQNVSQIEQVLDILPSLDQIVILAWQKNASFPFFKKIRFFTHDLILFNLYYKMEKE